MNRIRQMREARELTLEQLATKVGTDKTQISKLERGERRLTDTWLKKLAVALGVTPSDLMEDLAQTQGRQAGRRLAFAIEGDNTHAHRNVTVRELDVRARAGLGGGAIDVDTSNEESATVGHFGFPSEGFRALYGAEPDRVRIIEVVGDSMEPTLLPGQKVMIDTQDRAPTPPGIFVVYDGFGLVLKRVQYIPHSDPPQVRITSDNKEYDPYTRTLEEAHIQGRVIGGWKRF